jgi:2-polyprenyl-3-methyl-5-hydroxy-6-metoxy-1,4-benzoquinol methylase
MTPNGQSMTVTHQANRAKTDDWDSHWGKFSASDSLSPARAYRSRLVFELLALRDAHRPLRLLDLGSGHGDLASQVITARPDAEVVGLDLSHTGVDLAKKRVPSARFFQQDFTKPMALPDSYKGWATHAVCSEVLEHLDDPESMLRNVRPYMAPGCRLVITVPAGPMSAFDKHIGHRRHFSADMLERTLRGAGFGVAELRGAGFPFFNLYRLTVIARGQSLIKDAESGDDERLPLAAKAMLRAFSLLFKANTDRTRLGWQLVAVAVAPAS